MVNIECMNTTDNIYANGGFTVINIPSSTADFEDYDLLDEKEFKHYIDDLERIVRNSFEYRQLIQCLKKTKGMDECSFLTNVSSRENAKVKIELHHSPLTLYDICMTVFRKRQCLREDLNINSVAEEVMWLHYAGWVGLIPLSQTVHEMVHNQYLFIPLNVVRGSYKSFVNSYHDYIDPEILQNIEIAEKATAKYNNSQMELFNTHRIYVNVGNSNMLPNMNNTEQNIKTRIDDIKSGKKIMCENV